MAGSEVLRLEPQVKEVVWGGQWLSAALGRPGAAGAPLGESWEAYSGSVVVDGPAAGRTLGDLFATAGPALFGTAAAHYPRFPLLAKFIDAHQNLSVQVHPDDALAQRLENYPYGKTEFWYVLEAAPGAEVLYGLDRPGITRDTLRRAAEEGRLLEVCRRAPVRPGDVVFIAAGTIHALTEGTVVYEVQQDSDITYRLYDWGRQGRELHLDRGLQAVDLGRHSLEVTRPQLRQRDGFLQGVLAECSLFQSALLEATGPAELAATQESFVLVSVVAGQGAMVTGSGELPLRKGDTFILPAGAACTLRPEDPYGRVTTIASRLATGGPA